MLCPSDNRIPPMDIATRFGQNLVRCRKRAGLLQEELGFRSSLHRTEVGMLERGIRLPRIDTLIKLAGGIGIRPEELLDGLDWTPGGPRVGEFSVSEPPEGDPQLN